MDEKLKGLEKKKEELYNRLKTIGDLRRGTITQSYTKCGKKNCACAQEGHPGHLRYLWSTTIKGKSYAKNLKIGPEMEKYRQETENYRKFVELNKEILKLSEQICDLRPVSEINDKNELENLKKKLQALYRRKSKRNLNK